MSEMSVRLCCIQYCTTKLKIYLKTEMIAVAVFYLIQLFYLYVCLCQDVASFSLVGVGHFPTKQTPGASQVYMGVIFYQTDSMAHYKFTQGEGACFPNIEGATSIVHNTLFA